MSKPNIRGFEARYAELIEARDGAYSGAVSTTPRFNFVDFETAHSDYELTNQNGTAIRVASKVRLFGPGPRRDSGRTGDVYACLPLETGLDHAGQLHYQGRMVPYLLLLSANILEIGTADASKIGLQAPELSERVGYSGGTLLVPTGILTENHQRNIFQLIEWTTRVLNEEADMGVSRTVVL